MQRQVRNAEDQLEDLCWHQTQCKYRLEEAKAGEVFHVMQRCGNTMRHLEQFKKGLARNRGRVAIKKPGNAMGRSLDDDDIMD